MLSCKISVTTSTVCSLGTFNIIACISFGDIKIQLDSQNGGNPNYFHFMS